MVDGYYGDKKDFVKTERLPGQTILGVGLVPSERARSREWGPVCEPSSEVKQSPYLDNSCHRSPFWSRRKKRFFQRAMSGVELAWSNGEMVRFLSLSSSPTSPDLHASFSNFVKRVRREFGRFEYLAVREDTVSGLGHLHILFRGGYMPFGWVKANWFDIHKAMSVYIEAVRGNKRQVANYLVKYLDKSNESRYRFWASAKWVFRGFVGFWARIVREYQQGAVRKWIYFLRGGVLRFKCVHGWGDDWEYWRFDRGEVMRLLTDRFI